MDTAGTSSMHKLLHYLMAPGYFVNLQIDTLAANLGGGLGLYVGMSFVTVFEIVELIIQMTMWAILKIHRTRTRKINRQVDPP